MKWLCFTAAPKLRFIANVPFQVVTQRPAILSFQNSFGHFFFAIFYGKSMYINLRSQTHTVSETIEWNDRETKQRFGCFGALDATITIYLGFIWHPNAHCWWSHGFIMKSLALFPSFYLSRFETNNKLTLESLRNLHASYLSLSNNI